MHLTFLKWTRFDKFPILQFLASILLACLAFMSGKDAEMYAFYAQQVIFCAFYSARMKNNT